MAALTTGGDLREVIELQDFVAIDDGYGGQTQTWETVMTAPARIRTLTGGETVIAARLQGTQTLVATVRHQPAMNDVTSAWRAKNGRTGIMYNIRSVTVDERKAFVDILMESGVPA